MVQVLERVGEEDRPVVGQRLLARVENLVAAVPEEQLTDAEGKARFKARCPNLRQAAGRLIVNLPGNASAEIATAINIAVGAPDRVEASLENADGVAPWELQVGQARTLNVQVTDALGNFLAGVPVRLRIAEQALADRVTLVDAACGGEAGALLDDLECISGDDGCFSLNV